MLFLHFVIKYMNNYDTYFAIVGNMYSSRGGNMLNTDIVQIIGDVGSNKALLKCSSKTMYRPYIVEYNDIKYFALHTINNSSTSDNGFIGRVVKHRLLPEFIYINDSNIEEYNKVKVLQESEIFNSYIDAYSVGGISGDQLKRTVTIATQTIDIESMPPIDSVDTLILVSNKGIVENLDEYLNSESNALKAWTKIYVYDNQLNDYRERYPEYKNFFYKRITKEIDYMVQQEIDKLKEEITDLKQTISDLNKERET